MSLCIATLLLLFGFLLILSKRAWRFSKKYPLSRRIHVLIMPPNESEKTLAVSALKKGFYEFGADLLRRSLEIIPEDVDNLINLSGALAKFGRKDEALSVCDDALSLYPARSEEHTSELQSQSNLVCRLLLEKKKIEKAYNNTEVTRIVTAPRWRVAHYT